MSWPEEEEEECTWDGDGIVFSLQKSRITIRQNFLLLTSQCAQEPVKDFS